MGRDGEARSLKTATVVLRALRMLAAHPRGLTAGELGSELGKSTATARYMINTMCEAGFAERGDGGRYRLSGSPPWGTWAPPGGNDGTDERDEHDDHADAVLAEGLTDLHRRTRQRCYLVRRGPRWSAEVADMRGHRGLARLPGLDDRVPVGRAHALAMTKVLLAASPAYLGAVTGGPLPALTERTLVRAVDLRREVDRARERGHAHDDGEYADGFATIAAPVTSPCGTTTVALGLSTSARRYAVDGDELTEAVVSAARDASDAWFEAAVGRPQRPTSVMPKARSRR